ncbi:acetyl-CoA carboxylase, carboxyltransferase subunit beta [Clostridium perfringens]|uniref:acetyl-CoA carboxylase, carboxyltransferase subunit beta n=1 Tax=Clostridium perfringens TaxID=1502 RepID=UPI0039E92871
MIKGIICNSCKSEIQRSELDKNYSICTHCGYYMRMHARKRILSLADKNSFRELDANMKFSNPLNDREYEEKLEKAYLKYKLNDAIITGEMDINGLPVAIGVMDTKYMMASMGHVVGEKVTRLFEKATKKKLPVIIFCCSGGARMQEGIISLMQMEKTAAMVKKHSDAGLLYISVLTNPTMGGVTASFAMLADIIIAEKGAMIGFAGARVIEQTTGEKLPDGFQTADFQKDCGFVDAVVSRNNMRGTIAFFLGLHRAKPALKSKRIMNIELTKQTDAQAPERTPWETVRLARSRNRPTSLDYINKLFTDFFELSGDRVYGDDHAVVAGIATFHGLPVTVIGQQNGKKDVEDARFRNFGMPSPSGYRKALRLAKQAEKFGRPIIFFVDTIGAACGVDAERKGQGFAIATMLYEMSAIRVPVYSIVIGQGGSGGALAFAVGNEVNILENAVYSIITPEGYASIVWRDSAKAAEAAERMKMTSADLFDLHIVDKVIPEWQPVTIDEMDQICSEIELSIHSFLSANKHKSKRSIVKERFKRFSQY